MGRYTIDNNPRIVYKPFFCRFCKIPIEGHYKKWGWACETCVKQKCNDNSKRWRSKPENRVRLIQYSRQWLASSNYKERIKENKLFIQNYKETHPCVDCGKFYPYCVMDFDHQFNKKEAISTMTRHYVNLNTIKQEIAKCKLRCANCHRIKTHNEQQGKI